MKSKKCILFALLSAVAVMATGCSKSPEDVTTKVIFTTGFAKDEVFRIEKAVCTLPEIMVYLTNSKNQYENTFGPQIWEMSYEDESIEENIKDTVLARLARIKAMNLLAEENEVVLDDTEREKASNAAKEYYEQLNENERKALDVDEAKIRKMYEEYALATKVYEYLIADINPEISDDEARTITVEHIFFKTHTINEAGELIPNSYLSMMESFDKAKQALQRARDGEDFATLVAEYSDEPYEAYSFGKGTQEPKLEEVAFNLGTNEISDIIRTKYGYHIIKCISKFDRNETDINKKKIVEQKRKEVFNEKYSAFVKDLTKNMNKKLWDNVEFIQDDNVTTMNFFDIYIKYFEVKS